MKHPNKTYSIHPWPLDAQGETDEVFFKTHNQLKREGHGFRMPYNHAAHVVEVLLKEAGYQQVDDVSEVESYFREVHMRKLKTQIRKEQQL